MSRAKSEVEALGTPTKRGTKKEDGLRVKSEVEALDTPTKRGTKKEDGLLTPKSVKNGKEKLTPGKDKETVLTHSLTRPFVYLFSLVYFLLIYFTHSLLDFDTWSKGC